MRPNRLVLGAAALLGASALGQEPAAPKLEHLWAYAQWNFQVPERVAPFLQILRRAKAAGYTGVVLADYKFTKLGSVPRIYFENVARVKAEAKQLGLMLVPSVFPIGYSNGLLASDPNLAEGMPVRDALFVARGSPDGGEARLVPDPPVALRNGDFEDVREDGTFAGWDWQDKKGALLPDRETVASGKVSARVRDVGKHDPEHGHARIVQKVRLSPWRCYRVSVRVKTQSFWPTDAARITVLADGKSLHHQTLDLKRTEDWVEKRVVFDSREHAEATVYLGTWEAKEGTLWWDDARIEEVGLLNALRRDGCPLVVRGEDGTVYQEGRDFAEVRDPCLGAKPWPGEYDVDHEGPAIRLLPGGRIGDGARLRVSWWFPPIIHEGQVMCCVAEPAVGLWCRDQMERVAKLFGAPAYFWQHDEIRCLGWCETCRRTGLTPGGLLARNARECWETHRAGAPGTMALAWSDMWDPHHNARDDYYLVKGDLARSWEGLPKEVAVVNWNFGKRRESLRFFAGRGHKQVIAGYYDEKPAQAREWLEAARGVPGVTGIMYTTWQGRYDDLEEFARVVREFR